MGYTAAYLQINFSSDSKICWDHHRLCNQIYTLMLLLTHATHSMQIPATLHCAGYTQESITHLHYSISALWIIPDGRSGCFTLLCRCHWREEIWSYGHEMNRTQIDQSIFAALLHLETQQSQLQSSWWWKQSQIITLSIKKMGQWSPNAVTITKTKLN